MKTKLMDAHAKALDAKRHKNWQRDRNQTWKELAEYLHLPWWKRIFKKKKETRNFWV